MYRIVIFSIWQQIFGFSQWLNTNTEHRLHSAFILSLSITLKYFQHHSFFHITSQFT